MLTLNKDFFFGVISGAFLVSVALFYSVRQGEESSSFVRSDVNEEIRLREDGLNNNAEVEHSLESSVSTRNPINKNESPSLIAEPDINSSILATGDGCSIEELNQLRKYAMLWQGQELGRYVDSLGAKNQSEIKNVLSRSFDSEPATTDQDPSGRWSYEQKNIIDKVLLESDEFSNLSVIDSECKSTQCRVSLLKPEDESFASIPTLLGRINTDNQWEGYSSIVDEESGVVEIYFLSSNTINKK